MDQTQTQQQVIPDQPKAGEDLTSNVADVNSSDAQVADASVATTPVESPVNKQGGYDKRIAKLTAQLKESRERERHLASVQNNADYATRQPVSHGGDVQQPSRPSKHEFSDPMDFAEALIKYEKDSAQAQAIARHQSNQKLSMQHFQQNLNNQHVNRVKDFAKSTPDYVDSVSQIEDMLNLTHVIAIQKSPKSAEIAYYLSKNIEEALDFSQMDPVDAAVRVGELTERLKSRKVEDSTNTTTPMAPIPGSSNTRIGQKNMRISELRQKYFGKRG